MKKYYAHTKEGKEPEEWQLLEEHLEGVAEQAAEFADLFQSSDWAWNAGWLHDMGKATQAFQAYLMRCNELDDSEYDADGSISNHASAGAAYAFDNMGVSGKCLAYVIAGHHTGLPDYHTGQPGHLPLRARLVEGRTNLATIQDYTSMVQEKLRVSTKPEFVTAANLHMWIRMLFSCVVDADRLNTESFTNPGHSAQRNAFSSLADLRAKFEAGLSILERSAPPSPVNAIRSEIRRACEGAAGMPSGLFSLDVPTGGGKTLSSMAFAFRHALKQGKRRIIYVIPYTSIIEQTARILGEILGHENIVEHHSNVAHGERALSVQLAAENWDAPIIVTTNVQFFESLYAAHTGAARKLHNIVNSVVILDEAQLLPASLITPVVAAMNDLVEHYGVTIVMATATQPALPGLRQAMPIISKDANLATRLQRTEWIAPVSFNKPVQWTDLAGTLCEHEQVLCIVNTRRDCHDLHKLMPIDTIHLSALMCGTHRSRQIAEIKRRLKAEEPCRVISTQLVEAGVDIDFPVVYRAMAGLDSIAQAAGRCNREGRLNDSGQLGRVHIFVPPAPPPTGLLRKAEAVTRELWLQPDFNPQQPDAFQRFFQQYYSDVNDTGHAFATWLSRDVHPDMAIQFRMAAGAFSIIDDSQQECVIVHWGGNDPWIEQLRMIGPTSENLRALQRSMINLYRTNFDRALAAGLIEEVHSGVWLWIGRYDPVFGLDIFEGHYKPEELIG